MALNVNRNVDDAFYRYKMPRLQAKVEGKGNGIKTVIANMSEIAKALNRPPTYPTKYFGCELGAQTQFDFKNERYIVNGEHDAHKLQELLDGFIRKFVLCPGCDNPETTLTCKKNQIMQACKACGYSGLITHKTRLTTFIVKNPPASVEEGAEPVKKGKGKKGGEKNGSASPTEEKEEVGLSMPEDQTNGFQEDEVEEEEEWDPEDIDAPDNRAQELTGAMAALAMNPDLEKSLEERLDMFHTYFLKALKAAGSPEKLDSKAIAIEAERLDVKEKAPLLLARELFDDNVMKEIKVCRKLLTVFTRGNARAQRYLLGGVEQLVSDEKYRESLMPKVAYILKALYDEDIVDEETLLEWGKKASKKYVSREVSKEILEKAAPLLQWLEEAEEESSEEEEEGVTFEEKGRGHVKLEEKPTENGVAGDDGKVDDIDIDDI